jgi:hypothetical protein
MTIEEMFRDRNVQYFNQNDILGIKDAKTQKVLLAISFWPPAPGEYILWINGQKETGLDGKVLKQIHDEVEYLYLLKMGNSIIQKFENAKNQVYQKISSTIQNKK